MNLNMFVFIAAVFYLWLTVVINYFSYISVAVHCLFDSENQHLWENLVKRMSDRLKCRNIFCTYSNCQVMTYLNKHYFVEILYKCHTTFGHMALARRLVSLSIFFRHVYLFEVKRSAVRKIL